MALFLITTHATGGDVYPFLRLARFLKKRGHRVRVFTHCVYNTFEPEEGIDFTPLDSEEEFKKMYRDMTLITDPLKNPQRYREYRKRHRSPQIFQKELELILPWIEERDTVLVGRCRSSAAAMAAAEIKGVPYVSVHLAPSHLNYMVIAEEAFGEELTSEINEFRCRAGLQPISGWLEYMTTPRMNAAFWPGWFACEEPQLSLNPQCTGFPLSRESESGLLPENIEIFFKEHKDPVLITAGSSLMIDPAFYRINMEALKEAGIPAIIACSHDSMVPETLPETMVRGKFLPFAQLMPRVSAVIHHGGIGTVSRALADGIPQLIMAQITDGPDNGVRAERLGVGKYLPFPKWSVNNILTTLKFLREDPSVREKCREYSRLMVDGEALEKAVSLLEKAVNNKTALLTPVPGKEKEGVSPKKRELSPEMKRKLALKYLKRKL